MKSPGKTGSHMRLTTTEGGEHHVTIPQHDPLRVGTLSSILNDIAEHLEISRDELLTKVWDGNSDSFDRTVDAHIKTLRAKLKAVAPQLEAIRTLRGSGYALSEELPAAI